jgi:hypothetical protein
MSALAKISSDAPAAAPTPSVLTQRWVRIAVGLGLLGLSLLLAVATLSMPFVVIRTSQSVFYIGGSEQSGNLHLVLGATGIVGAVLALIYALGSADFRASFFVVGGVATGFSALLLGGAWQTVQRGTVADPGIYSQIKQLETVMQIGSGLWASLVAGLGILALAVVVLLASRAAEPPVTPPASRRRQF